MFLKYMENCFVISKRERFFFLNVKNFIRFFLLIYLKIELAKTDVSVQLSKDKEKRQKIHENFIKIDVKKHRNTNQ